MKKIQNLQKTTNKIETKVNIDGNGKFNKKDININNKNSTNKKYILNNESKNKQLTIDSLFKPRSGNNYRPVTYKNSNSNPFRNSIKKVSESAKNNKSNIIDMKKLIKNNIVKISSNSENQKSQKKENEIKNPIKKWK